MTAEPRDVEDWCGSPVSHEPHPGCPGWPSAEAREFIETAKILAEPYNEKIAALESRLAAADRENAELRGEVERLRGVISAMNDDADQALIDKDEAVEAESQAGDRIAAERDDLRAQLAAAQAQLAEARAAHDIDLAEECGHQRAMHQAISDEFQRYILGALVVRDRLMAARRALIGTGYFTEDEIGPDIAPRITELHAALSAAPQPEPDDDRGVELCPHCGGSGNATTFDGDDLGACPKCLGTGSDEPPASDEPALCEHDFHATNRAGERIGLRLAGAGSSERCPAASGTPDGGL